MRQQLLSQNESLEILKSLDLTLLEALLSFQVTQKEVQNGEYLRVGSN